jgi:glutamate N-acetyltransferase/amino-acid N-acetyltransferase
MPELHLLSPRGFRAGAAYAGIRSKDLPDVALLVCESSSPAAAVFTTNKVASPSVLVGRKHVARGKLRAAVVNAGVSNACTGRQGHRNAIEMCSLTARLVGCSAEEVLPCSTGIIGQQLPMEKIAQGIAGAFEYLGDSQEHALRFADAILTTDTRRKQASAQVKIGREIVTVAGVCKGSGMIGPRMTPQATMLAYLTTDAAVTAPQLRRLLRKSTEASFNAVTIDDHTSTSDTACIIASGASAARVVSAAADVSRFKKALDEVCQSLAYQIAADGEGATKVVRIDVIRARSETDAKTIARAIANSPLVKCAMHGNDPNWGRIVSAAGMTRAAFDPDKAVLKLQGTPVFRRGEPLDFDERVVSRALASEEVRVELSCNLGKSRSTCWTCDLSRQYVTINADYHT